MRCEEPVAVALSATKSTLVRPANWQRWRSLLALRGTDIDTRDVTGRPHHFGEHLRGGSDAATKVSDSHALLQARLAKDAAACGRINAMESREAFDGGFAGGERVLACGGFEVHRTILVPAVAALVPLGTAERWRLRFSYDPIHEGAFRLSCRGRILLQDR